MYLVPQILRRLADHGNIRGQMLYCLHPSKNNGIEPHIKIQEIFIFPMHLIYIQNISQNDWPFLLAHLNRSSAFGPNADSLRCNSDLGLVPVFQVLCLYLSNSTAGRSILPCLLLRFGSDSEFVSWFDTRAMSFALQMDTTILSNCIRPKNIGSIVSSIIYSLCIPVLGRHLPQFKMPCQPRLGCSSSWSMQEERRHQVLF